MFKLGATVVVVALAAVVVAAPVGIGILSTVLPAPGAASLCQRVAGSALPAWLTPEQSANAAVIIEVGLTVPAASGEAVPPWAWVVAIATAMQESGLRNLPDGDRDSLGLFQQRPSQGWGTPSELLDPATAARRFYSRLSQIPGWASMPLTQAAQAVQRSDHPQAYARWEADAVAIVAAHTGLACSQATSAALGISSCPLVAPSTFVDSWGAPRSGGRRHQGTDIMAPYGAAVLAVVDGTITTAGMRGGLGGIVIDLRGDDGTEYYYAHLAAVDVVAGQRVRAGQQIGRNGNTGNAAWTAPHVHFEIHPGGGAPINPYPAIRRVCRR